MIGGAHHNSKNDPGMYDLSRFFTQEYCMKSKILTLVAAIAISSTAFATGPSTGSSCSTCGTSVVTTQATTWGTATGSTMSRTWGYSGVTGTHEATNGTTNFQLEAGHLAEGTGRMTGASGLSFAEQRTTECGPCGASSVVTAGDVFAGAQAGDPYTEVIGQVIFTGTHDARNGTTSFEMMSGFGATGTFRASGDAHGRFSEFRIGAGN